ncbi:MAG: hypothetical protein WCH11_02125 [Bdellovibrio sp.]
MRLRLFYSRIFLVGLVALSLNRQTSLAALAVEGSGDSGITVKKLKLDEVTQLLKSSNLQQLENALRLKQAQEAIRVQRGNLLPKLNLWRALAVVEGWVGVIGLTEDLLPFLIPANWFGNEQQKILFKAQEQAYRAFLSNQILSTRVLFFQSLFDSQLEQDIAGLIAILEDYEKATRVREALGYVRVGATKEVGVRLLRLQEDARRIQAVRRQTQTQLALALGFGPETLVQAEFTWDDNFSTLLTPEFLDYPSFVQRREFSYELQQAILLESVNESILKSLNWVMFGVSSISRGVAGEFFERIPIQDGLGFGTPASRRILKLNRKILETQREIQRLSLEKSYIISLGEYRRDLDSQRERRLVVEQALELFRLYYDSPRGLPLEALEFLTSAENLLAARTHFHLGILRILTNHDKLLRIFRSGPYTLEVLK